MKLGIVGGGQLGRMLAQAALPMGVTTTVLDPAEDACAKRVADQILGNYDDLSAVSQLIENADVLTFEFENVTPEAVSLCEGARPTAPNAQALAQARDRWDEKSMFQGLQIPTAPTLPVADQASLEKAVQEIGLPAILKTRTLGYDGKGQKRLMSELDVEGAFVELGGVPLVLEGFVEFQYEVSCIGVRNRQGDIRCYPLAKNDHQHGMLVRSQPIIQGKLQQQAEAAIEKVMTHLQYVGVLAVEFFVTEAGLLVNEMAPRVHNSGHWTIEGCASSQFENHVRAVCDLPLGDTTVRTPVAMLNVIGARPERAKLLSIPGVHLHDYGKAARPARKIGHVTITAATEAALADRLAQVEALLVNDFGPLAN